MVCAERKFVGAVSYQDCHTEDAAVGGDKRKEHTQSLIERRGDFLEHNLNHLHKGRNNENKQNRLQELYSPKNQQFLEEIGNHRG